MSIRSYESPRKQIRKCLSATYSRWRPRWHGRCKLSCKLSCRDFEIKIVTSISSRADATDVSNWVGGDDDWRRRPETAVRQASGIVGTGRDLWSVTRHKMLLRGGGGLRTGGYEWRRSVKIGCLHIGCISRATNTTLLLRNCLERECFSQPDNA